MQSRLLLSLCLLVVEVVSAILEKLAPGTHARVRPEVRIGRAGVGHRRQAIQHVLNDIGSARGQIGCSRQDLIQERVEVSRRVRRRGTSFSDVDLSSSKGLSEMRHLGPSYIDLHTLSKSKGNIPEKFLRDCGLTQWQITAARLHDPNLTPSEIAEIQTIIFQQRTKGPLFIGGSFISYSWFDRIFVDKLYTRLQQEELSVWLDRHELVAGEIQKQIFDAIRLNDIVILVLSEASTQSDWVENELEMARRKEKEEHRAVLCPIALDDSWKAKMEPTQPNRALWLTIKQKLVIDFTEWDKNKAFEHQFQKLLRGLKRNYKLASQESVGRSIGSWLTSLTKTSEVS